MCIRDRSIIYDKSYHIILGILRDITAEEDSRASREQIERHTIEVTNQVIEKQMRTVQEIASLLGETTDVYKRQSLSCSITRWKSWAMSKSSSRA